MKRIISIVAVFSVVLLLVGCNVSKKEIYTDDLAYTITSEWTYNEQEDSFYTDNPYRLFSVDCSYNNRIDYLESYPMINEKDIFYSRESVEIDGRKALVINHKYILVATTYYSKDIHILDGDRVYALYFSSTSEIDGDKEIDEIINSLRFWN